MKGYEVVYYNKGYRLHAGNPQTFPVRKAAERLKKHYEGRPWFDNELFIEEVEYKGEPLSESRYFKGKEIVDEEHYFGLDCNEPGDLFDEDLVYDFMMLPPASYRSSCMQIGEPANHIDGRPTYATFKKIADGIYEYCGDCHKGQNVRPA